MSDKDDGGPAFGEFHQVCETSQKVGGMSLRDYFAAKAMAGLICGAMADGTHYAAGDEIRLADASYVFADAMLAERAK